MPHQGDSAGSYVSWKPLRTVVDPLIPVQSGETCGHCAAALLLRSSGIDVTYNQIVSALGHERETTAGDLVRLLNTLATPNTWIARWEPSDGEADRRFALYFPAWWLAMIKQFGKPAHWVACRGLGDDNVIEVCDSADGTRNWIAWSDFEEFWTRILVRPS